MQISSPTLHVFVEGRNIDKYIYGRIVSHACGAVKYRITRGDELPGSLGGGKSVILDYFMRLRRAAGLSGIFKGIPYATLFLADKDLDDLLHRKKRSLHVHYTDAYDIEGQIFSTVDIADAVAATCSIDPSAARSVIGARWAMQACSLWREWTLLCIVAKLADCKKIQGYSAPSQVNDPYTSTTNPRKFREYKRRLYQTSPLSTADMDKVFARAERSLDRAYKTDQALSLVKGKWLTFILNEQIRASFPVEHSRIGDFKGRVGNHAAQAVPLDAAWVKSVENSVKVVLSTLPNGKTQ